jgi:hypothetical protein
VKAAIKQLRRETMNVRPARRPALLWDMTLAAVVCRLRAGLGAPPYENHLHCLNGYKNVGPASVPAGYKHCPGISPDYTFGYPRRVL